MKKALSVLLVLCLAFCLCVPAFAEDAPEILTSADGKYAYTLDDNGCAVITEYLGHELHCRIPLKLDDHTVVGIGEDAFRNKRFMRSVSLPVFLSRIGEGAFACCDLLQKIEGGQIVYSVGACAFEDCLSLTEVYLPSLKEIPDGMFTGCWRLRAATFSDKLTKIGDWAFWGCESLRQFSFPETLTEIGAQAFKECGSLREAVLPDGLEVIPYEAFMQCTHLKTVKLPANLREIGEGAFAQCWRLRGELRIPDSVTTIDTTAFNGCSSRLTLAGKAGSAAWHYCAQDGGDAAPVIGDDFSFRDVDTGEVKPMGHPLLHDLFYGGNLYLGKIITIPLRLYADLVHQLVR